MIEKATSLKGKSGAQYVFGIVPRGTIFKARPGVYVLAKESGADKYEFCYVGHSADLSVRPLKADKTACFDSFGADCIFILEELDAARRTQIASDLVQAYGPICNA